MKKQKQFLTLISGIAFVTFPVMHYFYGDSHPSTQLRLFYHILSGIFLTFIYTLLWAILFKRVTIVSGIIQTILLTLWWEFICQVILRYSHNHNVYIQWDQVICDCVGIGLAVIIWGYASERPSFNK
jgi:hypothetical protein